MRPMRALLSMALCLAAAAVKAEPSTQGAGLRPAAAAERRVEKFAPAPAAMPSNVVEPQRKQLTAVALTFTDDADSVRLPPFATRTTPLPTRFLRVGVEWSF
jgi:hypothetical protein